MAAAAEPSQNPQPKKDPWHLTFDDKFVTSWTKDLAEELQSCGHAFSINPPEPELVLIGARRVCNRPFKMCQIPPSGMWAAIYAGNRDRQAHNASDAPIYQYYLSADYRCPPASINLVDPLLPAPTTPMPRGCIVGFVHVLLGPLTHEELTQVQPPPHPACLRWAHPPFCYVFGRSLRLPEPVPCQPTGSGAWEMTAETHHQIQQQLKRIAEACAKQEAVAASSAPSSSVAAAPAPAPVESASITRAPSSSSS